MESKQVIEVGEAFERLLANDDFKVLQRLIQDHIQSFSSAILGPDGPDASIKDFSDYKKNKGILLGLAMPQSDMEAIIAQMKVVKEERRKAEEEKRAKAKQAAGSGA